MKNLITLLIVFFFASTSAQEKITLNITQDAKLLFVGDDKGNEALTPDIAISSEWQGKQFNSGYLFIRPEFEYAELQEGEYRRYSANVGYTFNKWIDNVSFTSSLGYGVLDYSINSTFSFGFNLQTNIKITNGFWFVLDLETVERKDLLRYNSTNKILGTAWRTSGKIGLKINLFDTSF